jgi:phage gpG-like protein
MIKFKIEAKGNVSLKLDALLRRQPKTVRRILALISEQIVRNVVVDHLSGTTLHRVTGTLAKSITYSQPNDFTSTIGTNVRYAAIHEFGGTIKPKNGSFLSFKIKDRWVHVREVHMPARPYLRPSIEKTFNSGQAASIAKKEMNIVLKEEGWSK